MTSGSTKEEQDLLALKSTVSTIVTLITQLQTPTPNKQTSTVNTLQLAHDSASLIKAHSTKLSLLIINKPFTPSAITKVLRELISGPLPGLASAVEICIGTKYTTCMQSELEYRASKVFSELSTFINAIPLNGKILSDDQKNGTGDAKGKGSLANTGVIWQACEAVMELKSLGIAGLVVKKAEEYRDLLKDALEELREWGEEESDGEEDEKSSDEETELTPQKMVDDLIGSQRHIPTDDPELIRPRLESTQKRLRLLILMYQAVIKRRFKTLPDLTRPEFPQEPNKGQRRRIEIVSCLDDVLEVMKEIPDATDELASSFYELDGKDIDRNMENCFPKGLTVVELLLQNWGGKDDEFTIWGGKFKTAME